MSKLLIGCCVLVLTLSLGTGSAQAQGYGGGYRSGYGYGSGGHSGHRHHHHHHNGSGWGYGGYGGYAQPRWHDTSHFDYHPTTIVPHRNHVHVVPGHYDYHRSGHWHW